MQPVTLYDPVTTTQAFEEACAEESLNLPLIQNLFFQGVNLKSNYGQALANLVRRGDMTILEQVDFKRLTDYLIDTRRANNLLQAAIDAWLEQHEEPLVYILKNDRRLNKERSEAYRSILLRAATDIYDDVLIDLLWNYINYPRDVLKDLWALIAIAAKEIPANELKGLGLYRLQELIRAA